MSFRFLRFAFCEMQIMDYFPYYPNSFPIPHGPPIPQYSIPPHGPLLPNDLMPPHGPPVPHYLVPYGIYPDLPFPP